MNKNVMSVEHFSIEECRFHPDWLFIFGDNKQAIGKGGQATIRDEPNSFGISTKYSVMESYDDKRLLENKQYIDLDVLTLKQLEKAYDKIVFPKMGLGTGLTALQALAPATFIYLCQVLLKEFGFNNMKYLVPIKR